MLTRVTGNKAFESDLRSVAGEIRRGKKKTWARAQDELSGGGAENSSTFKTQLCIYLLLSLATSVAQFLLAINENDIAPPFKKMC